MNIAAIILARGGSKGIPNKNIIDFCGKPLIEWTINNCKDAGIDNIYISSDSKVILDLGKELNCHTILRPFEFSRDNASSESAWGHSLKVLAKENVSVDWVVAPQVTSPLRTPKDIKNGLKIAKNGPYDSLFSSSPMEDLFYWEKSNGILQSVNYDWRNRQRRQDLASKYIENGSFYLFKPNVLLENNNRFGNNIGMVEMEFWKMFEIDNDLDLKMCSALMKEFIIKKKDYE